MHPDSAAAIRHGLRLARWNISDLWVASVAIGGGFSHHDIDQIAAGDRPATAAEHDILALALNEHFVDEGQNHPIHYWHQLAAPSG